jgi:hypothetical protein
VNWRAKLLSETLYPKTTTVNSAQKMSGIEALKGIGGFLGDFSKLAAFMPSGKLPMVPAGG